MISFLLSLLVLLLYAAIACLIIWLLLYFFTKIFNTEVPPRVLQLLYAIVGLLFVIWLVQSLATSSPVPAPWNWK